jgi:hypothetical protein
VASLGWDADERLPLADSHLPHGCIVAEFTISISTIRT